MLQKTYQTSHLPPDVQEMVDTIMAGVLALASRVNSNSDSNSLGGTIYYRSGRLPTVMDNSSFAPSRISSSVTTSS